jgi:hypothetical protein
MPAPERDNPSGDKIPLDIYRKNLTQTPKLLRRISQQLLLRSHLPKSPFMTRVGSRPKVDFGVPTNQDGLVFDVLPYPWQNPYR